MPVSGPNWTPDARYYDCRYAVLREPLGFPRGAEILADDANLLEVGGSPVLLKVAARIDEDQLRLTVQSISDLENATASAPVLLKIWINDYQPLGDLKSLVEEHSKVSEVSQGNATISLMIPSESREVEVDLMVHTCITGKYMILLKEYLV